jgi:hypothetical protein
VDSVRIFCISPSKGRNHPGSVCMYLIGLLLRLAEA